MKRLFPLSVVPSCSVFAILALATLILPLPVEAAIRQWDGGGGDDNWTTDANWDGAVSAGDFLRFGGSTRLTPENDFAAATSFAFIEFLAGADAFTLGGNSITLSAAGFNLIDNNSSNVQTIDFDIILDANHGVASSTADLVINGVISGSGVALNADSTKMVTFNGANTMSGTVTVSSVGSELRLGNANAIQFATLNHTANGAVSFAGGIGTFYASGKTGSRQTNLEDVDSNPVTMVLQGTGGAGSASFTGSGALVVDLDPGEIQSFTGAGSWTGGTTVSGGIFRAPNNQIIPSSGALTVNTGGTLEMYRSNSGVAGLGLEVASLSGDGGLITWTDEAGGGSIGNSLFRVTQDINTTYSGAITEGDASELRFEKRGTGVLTLSGTNSWTGATFVIAGTLLIDGDHSGVSGNTEASSGTTLGGSGIIGGNAIIFGGATLSPGNSPGVLTFNNDLSLRNLSDSLFEIDGTTRGTQYDGVNVLGDLSYEGDLEVNFGGILANGNYTFNLFDVTGSESGNFDSITMTGAYTGSLSHLGGGVWELVSGDNTYGFATTTGDFSASVVPEASTVGLLGLGIGLILALVPRTRKSSFSSSRSLRSA